MVHNDDEMRHALRGGASAGVVAGCALTLFMTLMSMSAGRDIWYGMKGAAAPFMGARAMTGGFDGPAVVLGMIDHLMVSVIWGMLFSLVAYGLPKVGTVLLGVVWSIPVWLGMYYVVLPAVGLEEMVRDASVGRAIVFHMVLGLALGLAFLTFQQTHERRTPFLRPSHPSSA